MSDMYRAAVPLDGALLALVAQVNRDVAGSTSSIDDVQREFERGAVERHGAIRVGTAEELGLIEPDWPLTWVAFVCRACATWR
jgi:uncharacterized glyoxalase superfamily metalloenzyme YdcJ